MYCPKCGDVLEETAAVFRCVRGDMELSRHLGDRLRACYITLSERPMEPPLSSIRYKGGVGGRWFCPGCGVSTEEKTTWDVRCPQCGRSIWGFIHDLVELHPHRDDDGRYR